MPKEYIHNRWFGQYATEVTEITGPEQPERVAVPLDDSMVKVGWTKDAEHVEIALVWGPDLELPDEFRHAQMDRNGLNRLIRTLRTARDDAFGKDA